MQKRNQPSLSKKSKARQQFAQQGYLCGVFDLHFQKKVKSM
jgi:hypothetical protein